MRKRRDVDMSEGLHTLKEAPGRRGSRKTGCMGRVRSMLFRAGILACAAFALTGCHGSRGSSAFQIPGEFDTARQHEIVFWAKNDTNKTQSGL